MRFRALTLIVPIVVMMMVTSAAGSSWWTSALTPLVRTHGVLPQAAPVTFAASDNADNSDSADNADNSDGGDNADNADSGDNSGSDNADNSDSGDNSGSDNADNSDSGDNSGSDNADNSDSSDNSSSDNADNSDSSDNSDSADNTDSVDSADNTASEDGGDNVDASDSLMSPALSASPTAQSSPAALPAQANGTSTGNDADVALPNSRVTVHLFPSMPAGLVITVSAVDPTTLPPPPGAQVRGLTFSVTAQDGAGTTLTALPAEVHVHTQYGDNDLARSDDQNVTLYRLDPTDNQWKPATKIVADPAGNVVEASTVDLGDYVVAVP